MSGCGQLCLDRQRQAVDVQQHDVAHPNRREVGLGNGCDGFEHADLLEHQDDRLGLNQGRGALVYPTPGNRSVERRA